MYERSGFRSVGRAHDNTRALGDHAAPTGSDGVMSFSATIIFRGQFVYAIGKHIVQRRRGRHADDSGEAQ
jgi:hypothetical protein